MIILGTACCHTLLNRASEKFQQISSTTLHISFTNTGFAIMVFNDIMRNLLLAEYQNIDAKEMKPETFSNWTSVLVINFLDRLRTLKGILPVMVDIVLDETPQKIGVRPTLDRPLALSNERPASY